VSRRFRLALFLAALACAGPMPSARGVEAARLDVCIAWICSDRSVSPKPEQGSVALLAPGLAPAGFNAHPAPVLSPALLPRSLFQRPPPLQI